MEGKIDAIDFPSIALENFALAFLKNQAKSRDYPRIAQPEPFTKTNPCLLAYF
jgi:hypothetical protein